MAPVPPPPEPPIWRSVAEPVRVTVCDFEASLSLIVKVPERAPDAVGAKSTAIEQLEAGATLLQLLVCEKSPVIEMLDTTSEPSPVFERVTLWGADVVLTN